MKKSYRVRPALAVALMLLIAMPSVILAADGKKHFKQGIRYEVNKQWDKAAQEYALANAEAPANVEYILHLQRALVSAGIMLAERGDMLAQQKDYNAAYAAYRQAFNYDPTNEVAKTKMRRMLEVQGLASPDSGGDGSGKPNKIETSYKEGSGPSAGASDQLAGTKPNLLANEVATKNYIDRRYPKSHITFRSTSLKAAIEQLAGTMRLNVVFDSAAEQTMVRSTPSSFSVDLSDVTPARALEIILTTNGLMYAAVDSRTIVIASDNAQTRMKYETQAVRVFYIKTGDINDMRNALQPLGIKQIIAYKQLNAFVVRDTPANLEVAEHILKSLDKDKAEVLIEINMYQVSHNKLLSLGNQFALGDPTTPGNLGLQSGLGGFAARALAGKGASTLLGPFGIALGVPGSSLTAFQSSGNAKLLASTQVHVLDGEQHTIRLGQRIPIQTASYPFLGNPVTPTGTTTGTTGANGTGITNPTVNNSFGFSGIPQIQYENVGLNIDMTPTVTSDEVQMKMKIDSSSIDGSTSTLTPIFNQTTMQSVAKIRDGQTTMIAGISQNQQSKNVKGLPLVGLIPILGRFFTTPDNQNNQSDVVITVTPHILRSADVTQDDHLTLDVGPEANPRRQLTIEQILYMADHEQAQQGPVAAGKESPGQLTASQTTRPAGIVSPVNEVAPGVYVAPGGAGVAVMPVQTEVSHTAVPANGTASKPGPTAKTVKTSAQSAKPVDDDDDDDDDASAANKVNNPVQIIVRASPVATKGQQMAAAVIINGDAIVTGASVALTYDPNVFEVKGVRDGGMMRAGGVDAEPQFSADSGVLNVTLQRPDGAAGIPARGQLLYVILEVKGKGKTTLGLGELTSFRTASGQPVPVTLQGAQVNVQ